MIAAMLNGRFWMKDNYYIADQYGSYLPFCTTIYSLACHVAEAWRARDFEVYVVDGSSGRAVSEVYSDNEAHEAFARGYTDALFRSDLKSVVCSSIEEVDSVTVPIL